MRKSNRTEAERIKACCVDGCDRPHLARKFCQTHYMQHRRAGSEAVKPRRCESPAEYISRRSVVADSGCWEWQGAKFAGYGRLGKKCKGWPAHAYSFVAHGGAIPKGMQVNHKCHNRGCVNPEHLYAGTQLQNMADMREAGREVVARGEAIGTARLTAEQALAVYKSSGVARVVAQVFGVSESIVYAIRKKKIWRHIHE